MSSFHCEFLVILLAIGCLIDRASAGANTFPRNFQNRPPHRYISVSNECVERTSQEARDTAFDAFQELLRIQERYDRAVLANGGQPSLGISQPFVTSYTEIENDLMEELTEYFKVNVKDLRKVIRNYGVGAKGDYLCAFELFGEAVGDNIDLYEFNVKNLRHDLLVPPVVAPGQCELKDAAYKAGNSTTDTIRKALDILIATPPTTNEYDHFLTAYNFMEAFERAMWAYSDQLEKIYGLDADIWLQTLVFNGYDAPGKYACAYYSFYNTEHVLVESYIHLAIDVVQRTKNFNRNDHTRKPARK